MGGWKDWPLWLRGGIWGYIIGYFISLVFTLYSKIFMSSGLFIYNLLLAPLNVIMSYYALSGFLAGAVVSLIIREIKRRGDTQKKKFKDLPYWLKGGIIAIPLSILIIPLAFFLALYLGAGEGIEWYLAPDLYAAAMGLGMRGTPAGTYETILTVAIAFTIFLLRTFAVGAVIGALYGYFSKKNKGKLFLLCLLVFGIVYLFFISYNTKLIWDLYRSFDSPDECNKMTNWFVKSFDKNRCYQYFAVKNKDVKICDNIVHASSIEKNPEDFKWFCYEEVAHKKDDPSICELISGESYKKYGCFVWFRIYKCDEMDDKWRDKCYEGKAQFEKNASFCENIENSFNKDRCFGRLNMCGRIEDVQLKQLCLTH